MIDHEARLSDIINQIHFLAYNMGPCPTSTKLREIADALLQIGVDYHDLLEIDKKYDSSRFVIGL